MYKLWRTSSNIGVNAPYVQKKKQNELQCVLEERHYEGIARPENEE